MLGEHADLFNANSRAITIKRDEDIKSNKEKKEIYICFNLLLGLFVIRSFLYLYITVNASSFRGPGQTIPIKR